MSTGHSPRRVRGAPSIALYELRLLRTSSRPGALVRAMEPRIRRWRGLARWHMHAHSSARGEIVLQLVGERLSHVARVDNLFVSWRKTLQRTFQLGALKRGAWSGDALADVKLMHEPFDAGVAKLLAEAGADAVRCSYLEPALPSQPKAYDAPQQAPPRQQAPPVTHVARALAPASEAPCVHPSRNEVPRADAPRAEAPRVVPLSSR